MGKLGILVVDRPQPIYRPGEVVSGHCSLLLSGEMHLGQLQIKLVGVAECRWEEERTEDDTLRLHSWHTCLDMLYCPGTIYPSVLTNGQHNIGFNFQLPLGGLPSSFEGAHGHIRYEVEAKVHKTQFFSFDEKTCVPLTIQSPAFVSIQELSQPVTNSNHKTIGFFGGQKVSIRCSMTRIGQNIGTTIPIQCFVDNQSKKSMTLRASLKQIVVFRAQGSTRQCEQKVLRSVGNVIPAHSQTNEIICILVPITTPVVHNSCPIINIKYTIVVTLDIPGSIDLHTELPVIITNELLAFDQN